MSVTLRELVQYIEKNYPAMQVAETSPASLVFEERVKMQCYYCGKYDNHWKCPPRIPQNIDYRKLLLEYSKAAFIYGTFPSEENFDDVRRNSSVMVHRCLLALEKLLWEKDVPLALSFIGGSCKLCKNGCAKERCNNPYEARTSIEALGINVVKSLEACNIHISFPPDKLLYRVGLLLWD